MIIALGCDHGGYNLMKKIKSFLDTEQFEYKDFGCAGETCDYPDNAKAVTKAIQSGECDIGIVICGTGVGISIAANKEDGIRCALVSDCFTAEQSRKHNDANMIALGGRVLGEELAAKLVEIFLTTPFSNEERHVRRIKKMDKFYKTTPIS